MQKVFNFYSDPGHGWLKVPLELLIELKIADEITHCSYFNKGNAFLEEDVDSVLFISTMMTAGNEIKLHEFHTNLSSKIRKYEVYNYGDGAFNEDFHYNVPLVELDFIEFASKEYVFEIHLIGGIIRKFRGTKSIKYNPPYLTIR